jgi:hypothetical protein
VTIRIPALISWWKYISSVTPEEILKRLTGLEFDHYLTENTGLPGNAASFSIYGLPIPDGAPV